MDSSKIKALFIVVIAALFAVYLGVAAATAQTEAVVWVAALLGLAFVIALGKSVWILIPIGLVLQGTINAVPGSPPAWAVSTAIVGTVFIMRFALRRPDFVFRFDWLDAAVLLQLAAVVQAYLRNPTGLLMFGGEVAGGKSYFLFALAIAAYFGISLARPNSNLFKRVVFFMILTMICDGILLTISDWSSKISSLILPVYSNVNLYVALAGDAARDLSNSRAGTGFSLLGKALVIPCICLARPLSCLNPLRPFLFFLTMTGGVLVMLSGFRGGVAYLAAMFIVSAMVRRKYIDIFAVTVAGFLGLAVLLMSGHLRELPFGVQRVLSVLPVEVSSAARADAQDSSEWRFEMWKLALTTDHYIQNKALGDGFGLSSREMRAIIDKVQGIDADAGNSQERMLAQGSYHGFHVETIRFTGVLGLVCALIMMFVAFRKALVLLRYFRHHEIFPCVAYVCIPFLIYPFWAMLIFGAYRAEFPQYLAMAGLLKMLDNLRLSEVTVPVVAKVPQTETVSYMRRFLSRV